MAGGISRFFVFLSQSPSDVARTLFSLGCISHTIVFLYKHYKVINDESLDTHHANWCGKAIIWAIIVFHHNWSYRVL